MLKKLKSLFIVEEEENIEQKLEKLSKGDSKANEKKVSQPKSSGSKEIKAEKEIFTSNVKGPAKPRKKFNDILLKAIDKQNLDGPDYLEFKSSLKSLEGVIEDEATRYKSSYAVLTSTGVTKEKLLTSGEHYIKVLEAEKQKFERTFKEQQQKQVLEREKKINSYEEGIEKRKQELKKLIAEIETMEKKLDSAKVEINQAAGKVQLTKDQFMASYGLILGQIQEDFNKIKEYL